MKGLAAFTVAALLATEAAASCLCPRCILPSYRSFQAVSESMLPALDTGACFVAQIWSVEAALPERGSLIVFRHPVTQVEHVFRLIGLPGDRVQMRAGLLWLNGDIVMQSPLPDLVHDLDRGDILRCPDERRDGQICAIRRMQETLPGGSSYPVLNLSDDGILDNTAETLVPEGHIFVMGDNRDNAADSRVGQSVGGPGPIPIGNIWGVVTE